MLLGLDAIQLVSLREANAAYYFRVAVEEGDAIKQRLKFISKDDLQAEIADWSRSIQAVLPGGKGIIKDDKSEIKIIWGGVSAEECKENKIGVSGCVLFS